MDAAAIAAVLSVAIVVLTGVFAAGRWTGTGSGDVAALRAELSQAIASFREATRKLEHALRELGRDLDGTDIEHRNRWYDHDRAIAALDRRVAVLEHDAGVPPAVGRDTTDRISIRPDTGRHRTAEDSG